jgi:tetratricopeptide (TPR) repeat protein
LSEAVKNPVDVLERVVSTLVGDSAQPEYADLVASAAERYGQTTPFVRTLRRHVERHTRDLRALEGLVILSLGCREAAARERIEPVREARRLTEGLVNTGDAARACCLLEYLMELCPADADLRREYESIARKAGDRRRPIEYHLRLAQEAEDKRKRRQAIKHLRNALLLDPSRRDIAEWIGELSRGTGRPRITYVLGRLTVRVLMVGVLAGLVALGVAAGSGHEREARQRWDGLPAATPGDASEVELRLAAIELFVADVWLWSGMFQARAERAALTTELAGLRRKLETERDTRWVLPPEHPLPSDETLRLARQLTLEGDYAAAAEAFALALEQAPEDWPPREKVTRDLAALRAHLLPRHRD